MPTLDDLRAAFDELERQAPAALSEPIRPNHRRRWAAVGLAAACTAAVAVAVPLAAHSGDTPSRPGGSTPVSVNTGPHAGFTEALPAPAAGRSPELAYGFATDSAVAGYTVLPDQVNDRYQHASVSDPSDPSGGEIFVFYKGAFDASTLDRSDPVTVGSAQGYYADVKLPGGSSVGAALAWPYADGGWAVVRLGVASGDPAAKGTTPNARARAHAEQQVRLAFVRRTELLLAAAMVPAHDPLRSPVGIAAGSGLHVTDMSSDGRDGLDGGLDLAGPDGGWSLGWSPGRLNPADKPDTSTTEIAGHEWIVYRSAGTPTALGLIADGWGMTVTPDTPVSLARLEQFAAGLELAPDPSNPNTWFDAGTELP